MDIDSLERQNELFTTIKFTEYYIKFYEEGLEKLDKAYYILFPNEIKKINDKITNLYSEYNDLLLEKLKYGYKKIIK